MVGFRAGNVGWLMVILVMAFGAETVQAQHRPHSVHVEGPDAALTFDTQVRGREGILVMAHGGDASWNRAVRDAVEPLADEVPVAIAFGMANPTTLQSAVDDLEDLGVNKIAVVRLFISGESFIEQTRYLFGLQEEQPPSIMDGPLKRLGFDSEIFLGMRGLLDAERMSGVLLRRALDLSREPASESILFIAHGPADDEENVQWIRRMSEMASNVQVWGGFHSVQVATLREDWVDERRESEQEIRSYVKGATEEGRAVLVVPFRLAGFGPYADVLDGLSYRSDGRGLLPSPEVTEWIRREASLMFQVYGSGSTVGSK